MNLKDRLEKVEYQILKQSPSNPNTDFSDGQLINKVRRIYDAAINSDNSLDFSDAVLPLNVFGVSVKWSPDNTAMEASIGTYRLVDSLIDNNVPSPVDQSFIDLAFNVNGEVFLVNDDYFFTDTDWENMLTQGQFDPQSIFDDMDASFADITELSSSFDEQTNTLQIDYNAQEMAWPLPTIHNDSSTEIYWMPPPSLEGGVYSASDIGSMPENSTLYSNFIVESSDNGSQILVLSSNDVVFTATMSFTIDSTTYTKDYNFVYVGS